MKTIKIIDLLNKIANGEDVPKKIKYQGLVYEFNQERKEYQRWVHGIRYGLGEDRRLDILLNDEVEILEEEKKIPEKINENIDYIESNIKWFPTTSSTKFNYKEKVIIKKINELIDYLESKEKGE